MGGVSTLYEVRCDNYRHPHAFKRQGDAAARVQKAAIPTAFTIVPVANPKPGEVPTHVERCVPHNSTLEGGRAGTEGKSHLVLDKSVHSGRLLRSAGSTLCGGWAHCMVPADAKDAYDLKVKCPACTKMAALHGFRWPDGWGPSDSEVDSKGAL